MPIQILKESRENYVRNWSVHTQQRGLTATNRGNDAIQAPDTPPEGFAWRKTPIAATLKCTASYPRPAQYRLARKNSPSKRKNAEFGPI